MIKTILGAAFVVATLSTGAQALTIGTTVTTNAQAPKMHNKMMMMDKHHHMTMLHCKHFMHRAHGKCVSMMKMHKMKHHMMIKY